MKAQKSCNKTDSFDCECDIHVSLSLDDGVDVLGIDHAQHPAAEHTRGTGFHHDEALDREHYEIAVSVNR